MSEAEAFWVARSGASRRRPRSAWIVRRARDPERKAGSARRACDSRRRRPELQWLARQHHVTLNTIVQGVWALLLSRYGGERECSSASRSRGGRRSWPTWRPSWAPSSTPCPFASRSGRSLRSSLAGRDTGAQCRAAPVRVQRARPAAQRRAPRPPSLREHLVFENYPVDASVREQKSNVEVFSVRATLQSKYALTLIARPTPVLSFRIAYDTLALRPAPSSGCSNMRNLLEDLAADPARTVSELRELSKAERRERRQSPRGTKEWLAPRPQRGLRGTGRAQSGSRGRARRRTAYLLS